VTFLAGDASIAQCGQEPEFVERGDAVPPRTRRLLIELDVDSLQRIGEEFTEQPYQYHVPCTPQDGSTLIASHGGVGNLNLDALRRV
jgi:hypothetical protein